MDVVKTNKFSDWIRFMPTVGGTIPSVAKFEQANTSDYIWQKSELYYQTPLLIRNYSIKETYQGEDTNIHCLSMPWVNKEPISLSTILRYSFFFTILL